MSSSLGALLFVSVSSRCRVWLLLLAFACIITIVSLCSCRRTENTAFDIFVDTCHVVSCHVKT